MSVFEEGSFERMIEDLTLGEQNHLLWYLAGYYSFDEEVLSVVKNCIDKYIKK